MFPTGLPAFSLADPVGTNVWTGPMKVLAHVCCASCWLACAPAWDRLVSPAGRWEAFFVNPNIHPLLEFRRRLKAVQVLAAQRHWPLRVEVRYGLWEFLEHVDWRGEARCADCYRLRLQAAAEAARDRGFDHFTTTLLASTQQSHEAVRRAGAEVAGEVGVEFLAEDWRPLAQRAHEEARRRSLYRQQYCGCIFSEYERYRDTRLHLYRGAGGPAEESAPSMRGAAPGVSDGAGNSQGGRA